MSGPVQQTNADRVRFPDDGITKGDQLGYPAAVAPAVVTHRGVRPFTTESTTVATGAP